MKHNEENWQSERFAFLTLAKSFQRKKRSEGNKTKLKKVISAFPHSIVYWCKK